MNKNQGSRQGIKGKGNKHIGQKGPGNHPAFFAKKPDSLTSSTSSASSAPSSAVIVEVKRPTLKLNINRSALITPLPLKLGSEKLNTNTKDKNIGKVLNTKEPERNKQKNEAKKTNVAKATGEENTLSKGNKDKKKKDKGKSKFKKREVHPKTKMKPDEYFAILKIMQEKYPLAFTQPPKLLAINIHKDLIESKELNNTKIRLFLRIYCNSKKYKSNYVVGIERVNLKGEVVGKFDITKEEVEKRVQKQKEEKAVAKLKAKEKAETKEAIQAKVLQDNNLKSLN